jgi:hypothetical protein
MLLGLEVEGIALNHFYLQYDLISGGRFQDVGECTFQHCA